MGQAIGERGERFMSKQKVKYTNEPIGKMKIIPDFLPSPSELALKEETVKVTISLTKESIDFFKRQAKKHDTNYQKMIRQLLSQYSDHYKQKTSGNDAKSSQRKAG